MINQCLQSVFTQVNFFIHNLAQMKFSGHDDGTLLSFIPKTYRSFLTPLSITDDDDDDGCIHSQQSERSDFLDEIDPVC